MHAAAFKWNKRDVKTALKTATLNYEIQVDHPPARFICKESAMSSVGSFHSNEQFNERAENDWTLIKIISNGIKFPESKLKLTRMR